MTTLFGNNWKTTLFGLFCMLSMYLALNPSTLSGWMPEPVAKTITSAAATIAGFIAFTQAKDKDVSGNGATNNPAKVALSDGSQKILPLILIGFFFFFSVGCATQPTFNLPKGSRATITVSDSQATGPEASANVSIPLDGGGK
jgi:hypothetical protein